jgi:hypothetical protein
LAEDRQTFVAPSRDFRRAPVCFAAAIAERHGTTVALLNGGGVDDAYRSHSRLLLDCRAGGRR